MSKFKRILAVFLAVCITIGTVGFNTSVVYATESDIEPSTEVNVEPDTEEDLEVETEVNIEEEVDTDIESEVEEDVETDIEPEIEEDIEVETEEEVVVDDIEMDTEVESEADITTSDYAEVTAAGLEQWYGYTVTNGTAKILTVSESLGKDIVIPSSLGGYPVTAIGKHAFFWSDIETIVIPNSVTTIEEEAFYGATSLRSITIPDSVTSIGQQAFADCYSLLSIDLPNSITHISDYLFYNCIGLTSINIPDGVTSIGSSAFSSCTGLSTVSIPSSVTTIGEYAFSGCRSLINVSLPNSITSIGSHAFLYCYDLETINIPYSVTSIGESAFYDCESLIDITIPDGITSINNSVFYGCSSLTSIFIPSKVTSIGDWSFAYCDSLTSVDIPRTVTSIGSHVFPFGNGFTIYGKIGSYAQTYANQNGNVFQESTRPDDDGDDTGNDVFTVEIDGETYILPSFPITGNSYILLKNISSKAITLLEGQDVGYFGATTGKISNYNSSYEMVNFTSRYVSTFNDTAYENWSNVIVGNTFSLSGYEILYKSKDMYPASPSWVNGHLFATLPTGVTWEDKIIISYSNGAYRLYKPTNNNGIWVDANGRDCDFVYRNSITSANQTLLRYTYNINTRTWSSGTMGRTEGYPEEIFYVGADVFGADGKIKRSGQYDFYFSEWGGNGSDTGNEENDTWIPEIENAMTEQEAIDFLAILRNVHANTIQPNDPQVLVLTGQSASTEAVSQLIQDISDLIYVDNEDYQFMTPDIQKFFEGQQINGEYEIMNDMIGSATELGGAFSLIGAGEDILDGNIGSAFMNLGQAYLGFSSTIYNNVDWSGDILTIQEGLFIILDLFTLSDYIKDNAKMEFFSMYLVFRDSKDIIDESGFGFNTLLEAAGLGVLTPEERAELVQTSEMIYRTQNLLKTISDRNVLLQ